MADKIRQREFFSDFHNRKLKSSHFWMTILVKKWTEFFFWFSSTVHPGKLVLKSDGCEWTFQSRINLNIWSFAMPLLVFGSVHVAKHHSSLEDLEEAQKPSIIASRLPPCSYQIIKLSRHWSTADLLDCLMMGQIILGFKSRRNQLLNVTFATKGFFPIYTLWQTCHFA